jgi:mono/diheme cytochrome c family protein
VIRRSAAAAGLSLIVVVCVATIAAQQPDRSTRDGVFTAEQAKRGEALYAERCAACHGQGLAGMEAAPALAGPGFSASWSGTPLGDLFERIRISMPQDKPGSLGRQQTAEIVAFILSFNKAVAGQTDLPADADQLKTVIIAPVQ